MKKLFVVIALFVATIATGSISHRTDLPDPPCPPACAKK